MNPRYLPGYSEARANVEKMALPELLRCLDDLFGRDGLKYGDGEEEVRAEALRQVEREFTNPEWAKYDKPYLDAITAAARGSIR